MGKNIVFLSAAFWTVSTAMATDMPALFAPLDRLAAGAPAVIVNEDSIFGGGVIACGILENKGNITLGELPSIIRAMVINHGRLEVAYEQAVFVNDFINNGVLKTTDTVVRFTGLYQEHGAYISDPSDNYFQDLHVGETGWLAGGVGDNFYIRGDFNSVSTQNENWSTAESLLGFQDGFRDGSYDPDHDFYITGDDLGPVVVGYSDNFAWGIVEIGDNNTLRLLDGNRVAGGALYVGDITGLVRNSDSIENISSPDGINIYYRSEHPANSYLDGETYEFKGGWLIPIWPKSPDIDHDGDVDGADLALLAADMNSTCQPNDACYSDITDDGVIDEDDLEDFAPAFSNIL